MDLQKLIESMNENSMNERANYHLTYGGLIDTLRKAPKNKTVDKRIKGIGSWRGSYIEIAIFSDDRGFSANKKEYDYDSDSYEKWVEENVVSQEKLPRKAHELADLLEYLIGLNFEGYKGGSYEINRNKPLWLETDAGSYENVAILGIDENLNLITKKIED